MLKRIKYEIIFVKSIQTKCFSLKNFSLCYKFFIFLERKKMFKILLIILINLINYLIKANGDNVYDVIIVGGGVSGLSTASRLIKNGIDNILLIEADSRLGGRAHTINYS